MGRAQEAREQLQDPAAIEHRDANAKGLLLFITGLFVVIAMCMAGAAWLYILFAKERAPYRPTPLVEKAQIPPEPRLLTSTGEERMRVRAAEDAVLDTYGWVDRSKGIVRIPIGRAMALLAQRGLPTRENPKGPLAVPATGAPSGGPQTGPPQPRGAPPGQRGGAGNAPGAAGSFGGQGGRAGSAATTGSSGGEPGRGPATREPEGGGSRSSGPAH